MLDSIVEWERGGYTFIAMSDSWKRLCEDVPDSKRVQFPGYETKIIDTEINGQACVIQAWRGNCLEFPGLPGGIGGEVGLYKREPGRVPPRKFEYPKLFGPVTQYLAEHIMNRILDDALAVADYRTDIWWPTKDLGAAITMRFTNPRRGGAEFFAADPIEEAGGYWMSRWMQYASYVEYAEAGETPAPTGFDMEFTVAGVAFEWKAGGAIVQKG